MERLKEEIKRIVRAELNRLYRGQNLIVEGIDIDHKNHIISFNPNHQDNVDTNDYLHPYIIENDAEYGTILSIFERKDNESRTDGNPLLYALKGLNKWQFANPQHDIFALFRRFVAVTSQINRRFDTLLVVPSHNQLNNTVFGYLTKIIDFNNYFDAFFEKMTADEVENEFINYERMSKMCDGSELENIRNTLMKSFGQMYTENDGIFSYKFIPPKLRSLISKSFYIPIGYCNAEEISNAINDNDVLVFDDTVSSGKTLSEIAEAIRATFAPKSITFLTLFSPLKGNKFQNTRKNL